jgi:hypothetical protein
MSRVTAETLRTIFIASSLLIEDPITTLPRQATENTDKSPRSWIGPKLLWFARWREDL